MPNPTCPYCFKAVALRVEDGQGEIRQTVQCLACYRFYRAVVICEDGECSITTEPVDDHAA